MKLIACENKPAAGQFRLPAESRRATACHGRIQRRPQTAARRMPADTSPGFSFLGHGFVDRVIRVPALAEFQLATARADKQPVKLSAEVPALPDFLKGERVVTLHEPVPAF